MRVIDVKKSAENIKTFMKKGNTTVNELQIFVGCSNIAIYKWLRAECMPSLDNLVMLTEYFNCNLDDLVAYKEVYYAG